MVLNNKEKELLKTIGYLFSDGNIDVDGEFDKSWLDNWTTDEIDKLDRELLEYCSEVNWDIPDYFVLCIPISVTFRFLLWKLTERKFNFSLSIENYR